MSKASHLRRTRLETVSTALETNGRGYLGFLCDLPGAFIMGKTLDEALAKAIPEAIKYNWWAHLYQIDESARVQAIQIHQSNLTVEEADCEILLDADRGSMEQQEYDIYAGLALKSARAVVDLFEAAPLKQWIDHARDKKTFYGNTPKTLAEIFTHIDNVQLYYLSRLELPVQKGMPFLETREYCLDKIQALFNKENNLRQYFKDNEYWTVKKTLRRYIWHDRIHARSMVKILKKQKAAGLLGSFYDPFDF